MTLLMHTRTGQLPAAIILLAALLVAWFAYLPGTGGSLHFDDQSNLQQLRVVQDRDSALRFIASGTAGPLGRPLALASFAPQAYAWPQSTDVLLRTNILIHLVNGALVAWLLYLVGTARGQDPGRAAVTGAVSGAIWLLLPILASSSLFIVQRMTTLAAVFALAGAIGYLYARRSIDSRPYVALAGMTAALALGTAFGMLAKENGALLLIYVLVLEFTLLPRPAIHGTFRWRSWYAVVLLVPLVVLVAYLATRLPYPEVTVLRREFTGSERLITQAQILWQYLYLAFLPNPAALGPFHDHLPVQRTLFSPGTLLAVGSWIAVVTTAVALRKRCPLLLFAVAWYLLGHSLESSTLSLELYFEHRNYLPLIGPVYALIDAALSVSSQWRRVVAASLTAYGAVLAATLFSFTSLWGHPSLAAEMWYIYNPESSRAAQYLAQQLQLSGDQHTARRVLDKVMERDPGAHGVKLQTLQIACVLEPEHNHADTVRELGDAFVTTRFSYGIQEALTWLYDTGHAKTCSGVGTDALYRLSAALARNPSFHQSRVTHHNLHVLMARIGMENRDLDLTMHHMEKALDIYPNPYALSFTVAILNSAGLFDEATRIVDQAQGWRPSHPLRAWVWRDQLTRLQTRQLSLVRTQAQVRPDSDNQGHTP